MSPEENSKRDLDILHVVGITRECYCPYAASLALWIAGRDVRTKFSKDGILAAAKRLPHKKAGKEYIKRFLDRGAPKVRKIDDPPLRQKHMIEDAIVETEAILRKFALRDMGIDPGEITDAFRTHSGYENAAKGLQEIKPDVENLGRLLLATCPHCGLIGDLEAWFGSRVVRRESIPQAWCRISRSLDSAKGPAQDVLSLFDAESWFALSSWGKETGELSGWERRFAYSIGWAFSRGRTLSERQERVAQKVAAKALELGFKP